MLNIEKSLCRNFSDTDETEPDSVTFHDSVVQAELLYKSSNVVFDSIENDLFDDVDNATVIDCLTVSAAEETELMETRNGDKTDNLILVRCDDEVMSEAKWNGLKLCGNIIDKTVKPRNMTISKQKEAPLIDLEHDKGPILPSNDKNMSIIRNMAVLVARILVRNIYS
uniref:Uncharacterized protein n=1 Tax=Amphimedon queenslandica TaxID=400682 RepID=A0A1X7VAN4_AMPQE